MTPSPTARDDLGRLVTPQRDVACSLEARIHAVERVCREHVWIELAADGLPSSEPGQFLQLSCRTELEHRARTLEWCDGAWPTVGGADFLRAEPYLRRPFSIADRWIAADGRPRVAVLSRAVGPGTSWLDRRAPGESISITGPLGRGFTLPQPGVHAVLIGGGVGIPPLLYLARRLAEGGAPSATIIFGARSQDLFPLRRTQAPSADATPTMCLKLPADAPIPAIITTDDGSLGVHGRVTDGLRAWASRRPPGASSAVVLACGPEPMLRAVAAVTRELSMPCQLCIERNMGCGLGTCLSCVVRQRAPERPGGWRWALACTDGPVFDRDALPDYD